ESRAVKMLIDPTDGSVVEANAAAVKFYGHSVERLQGMTIFDISISPADVVEARLKQALGGSLEPVQCLHQLASGHARDVEVYASPIVRGGRTLLHSIVFDVTDRNRAIARSHAIAELGN